MARPEFEHRRAITRADWGSSCLIEDDPQTSWRVAEKHHVIAGWPDEVRERVARRSRERPEPLIEELAVEWAREDVAPLAKQFSELAATWRTETTGVPFVITRVAHWAYQRIIGMGPDALPLILRELARETDHWFSALNAITGEDPAEGVQEFEEAAARWLDWGRSEGLLT